MALLYLLQTEVRSAGFIRLRLNIFSKSLCEVMLCASDCRRRAVRAAGPSLGDTKFDDGIKATSHQSLTVKTAGPLVSDK